MLIRPDRHDVALIGLYTGRVLTGVGLVMLLPAVVGVLRGEYDEALGFVIGASLGVALGQTAEWRLATRRPLEWSHAMAVVALGWLAAAFVGAVPLQLSGHYGSFLDAYFDAMSGFATAGLAVINDLDHLADSVNLWRHLMQFLGGQGLVLVALSMFAGGAGLVGLFRGEAHEDRILPNVRRTAQLIWRIALLYGAVGTAALWAALLWAGLDVVDALLHAVMLFMAAFDTGGFAPTSASVGFYHSAAVEAVLAVLMVAGAISFAVHYHLLDRRPAELWRNIETRSLALTVVVLYAVVAIGLVAAGAYGSEGGLFRRGFFQLLSAHTGTGFTTVPSAVLVGDWGPLAPAALVVAMALGGMAGSTTGGIKALRLAITAKGLLGDARRVMLPEDAQLVQHYHSAGERRVLRPELLRSAVSILLLYLLLYFSGAAVGMLYGYPFDVALFESTSAAAAVGLSAGIVGPDLEVGLKVTYLLQMWIGRLEFVAVFALAGYLVALLRGRL